MGHHRRDLQQPLNRTALPVDTSDGQFLAIYSEQGLAELHFPSPVPSPRASAPSRSPSPEISQISQWHQLTVSAVSAILNGGVPSALPPFDLSPHSDFQRSVWAEMRKLSVGKTISYGELAARLGMPGAHGRWETLVAPIPSRCSFPATVSLLPAAGSEDFREDWTGSVSCCNASMFSFTRFPPTRRDRTNFSCSNFEHPDALTSPSKHGKRVKVNARHKTPWIRLGLAMAMVLAASIEAGERVQFRTSTSVELPTPKRDFEESRTLRTPEGPNGRSEYDSGAAAAGMNVHRNPQADKKLKEYLDKKKNWIFVNPYKTQYDSKTEEFMKGEKGTGLYEHRMMEEEKKSVMEEYLDEKNPKRDRESDPSVRDGPPEPGERRPDVEAAKVREEERREVVINNSLSKQPEDRTFTFSTDQKNPVAFGQSSLFEQKPERTALFNNKPLGSGTGLERSVSRDELRKERDARDAEITRMLQPRTAPNGARLDPLNTAVDATRQEASPVGARRTDSFLSPGPTRTQPSFSGISGAGGANAPLFSGGSAPSGIQSRPSFDFGSRANAGGGSSFSPAAATAPTAPRPSVNTRPFAMPLPQRKF